MAHKGNERHMKRLNAPLFQDIHRKEQKYVIRPRAGRHALSRAVPIALMLEKISSVVSMREAKSILSRGSVLVNGKTIKDCKYAVGLNDIIEVPSAGVGYRIDIDKQGHIAAVKTEKKESANLYKVLGKYKASGGKLMLRLHDGSVINGKADISVSDSVIVDNSRKIVSHLKMDAGAHCKVI